jgi:spermidine synthase
MKEQKRTPPEYIETEYGLIQIEETTSRGEPVRLYRHDGAFSSGTFLREEKKYEIVFDYPKKYEEAFRFLDIRSALMIGGAAYPYPKNYISHHEGSMDVVEIDRMAEKIAREWFFLDDLYHDFDLQQTGRLACITADARDYLTETDKTYDAVFNDAFSGPDPVRKLATLEAVSAIREHLTENGIYMSNIIGCTVGREAEFTKTMIATAKRVFRYVYVLYTRQEDRNGLNWGNYVVMATDQKIEPSERLHYHVSRFDPILTDAEL